MGTENSQLQQERRTASGDRLLFDRQKDGGLVFYGAAEAEPGGQRDAAGPLMRHVGEIEDDQAEASAFEQKISGAEDLLEAVFGLFAVSRSSLRILVVGSKLGNLSTPHWLVAPVPGG